MGSVLEIIWPFVIIGLLGYVFWAAAKKQAAKRAALFREQATLRGGTLEDGTLRGYPRLLLPYGDQEVRIYSVPGARNAPPCTYAECSLELPKEVSLTLSRESFGTRVRRAFGGQVIRTDNEEFDRAYSVTGSDELFARSFLTGDIQHGLLELKKLDLEMEFRQNRFELSMTRIPETRAEYDRFIGIALLLIEGLKRLA